MTLIQMGVNWCNFWGRIVAGVNVVVWANCRGGELTSTRVLVAFNLSWLRAFKSTEFDSFLAQKGSNEVF